MLMQTVRRLTRACLVVAGFAVLTACGGGDGVPAVISQPASVTVTAGQTATFTVTADGTLPLFYQWSRNGVAIAGANAASYTTPAAAIANSGALYSVRVSNLAGSAVSNPATLTVGPLAVTPTITLQPAPITVTAGQPADFNVMATGTTPLAYQWQRDGADIPGATFSRYSILTTLPADDGAMISAVVRNAAGKVTSASARLGVSAGAVAPAIAIQPANVAVNTGQVAVFKVAATGTGLTYQWRRNGVVIVGATGATFLTRPALPTTFGDNGRQFSVVVSNSLGSVTSRNAALTVTTARIAPNILVQSASVNAVLGQQASFSVAANGSTPLTFQWRKNGVAIVGAITAAYTTPAVVAEDSGAQFSVQISNNAGSVVSTAATLTVGGAAVAPSIATQPVAIAVVEGQPATFSVDATGTEPFTYQWKRNGADIPSSNAPTYTIASTTLADSGALFSVVVSNAGGNAMSDSAALTVTPIVIAPTITAQPENAAVNVGQTASFSVQASGTDPLAYQWRRNGQPISGARSPIYTTPVTVIGDNGVSFSVVVSNGGGSATSASATLTVTPAPIAPSITTQPSNASVLAGQLASFTVVATGSATLVYQWHRDNVDVANANSATYIAGPTQLTDNGAKFTVVVTNGVGAITSTVATLTVENPLKAAKLSAASSSTCALTLAGGVKCWGFGITFGGATNFSAVPVDVVGLTSGVADISGGYDTACAVTATGAANCWGLLAAVGGLDVLAPSGVKAVSTGSGVQLLSRTCLLTAAGAVTCGNSSLQTAVPELESRVTAISVGGWHACALMATGGVKCWGRNLFGELGYAGGDSDVPVDVIGLDSGVVAISAGGYVTCALTTAGGIKCWGRNVGGQLGSGNTISGPVPVDVFGLTSGMAAVSVSMGGAHTCGLTSAGGVKCWGDNSFGKLGNGSTGSFSTVPVDVVGLSSGTADVSARGSHHTCALSTTGTVKCWGINSAGELGDGSTTDSSGPVSVMGFP